ncbi:MAG: hypothetical protein IMZ66_05640, partial [Planctomycetes bacterium]|nr:hypothetical protein [Planctomycetota bacterium]
MTILHPSTRAAARALCLAALAALSLWAVTPARAEQPLAPKAEGPLAAILEKIPADGGKAGRDVAEALVG